LPFLLESASVDVSGHWFPDPPAEFLLPRGIPPSDSVMPKFPSACRPPSDFGSALEIFKESMPSRSGGLHTSAFASGPHPDLRNSPLLRSLPLQRTPAPDSHYPGTCLIPVAFPSRGLSPPQGLPPSDAPAALFHAARAHGVSPFRAFPSHPPVPPDHPLLNAPSLPTGTSGLATVRSEVVPPFGRTSPLLMSPRRLEKARRLLLAEQASRFPHASRPPPGASPSREHVHASSGVSPD